jgi:hypothetical protein
MRSGINTWIDIGIMLIIRIYIFNGQFKNFSHFLFLFLFEFEEYLFFWYYIHIKTQVNRNFRTSTFLLFLVFRWTLRPRSLILFNPSNYKNNNTLNNNNSCNNNFKYCFNQLYYDCKHLIVLIIVECRFGLVQSATQVSGSIIVLY